MSVRKNFQYDGIKIPMTLDYSLALGKFEDLGLDVLGIVADGGETLQRILLDDRMLLKVWYHYVSEETGDDWEAAIKKLDEQENGLSNFREEFFKLIVSFSNPQIRTMLEQMWVQAKKELADLQKLKSMISSSGQQPEQD